VAIQQALVSAGARAHFTARFSAPGFRPVPDSAGAFVKAVGGITIDLLETLNP